MLDVDGTTVPYDYGAVPSDAVAKAVIEAREKVLVCIVTGRSFVFIEKVLEKFAMNSGYAVVMNGAMVIDIATKKFLYEQQIALRDAVEIAEYLQSVGIPFYLKQDTFTESKAGGHFIKDTPIESPYMFFSDDSFTREQIDTIFHDLSHLNELSLHKSHHKIPDRYGFNISHVKASKLHGIEVILKETGINKEAVIAMGDGYNDFPLLMAAGLKVAMGNAVPELKEIADVIAPSVDEDGVAAIIHEYILTR